MTNERKRFLITAHGIVWLFAGAAGLMIGLGDGTLGIIVLVVMLVEGGIILPLWRVLAARRS